MSQSPSQVSELSPDHPYARGAQQLNRLVRIGKSFSGHERNCCYLNLQGQRFANLSSISGIDFADDGRAIAAGDWDFDGDVDFWVANRTGPQIRWMRNENQSSNHFVSLRLSGTQSNRDAIGATVRVFLRGSTAPLIKSVRAGEGYLAQGSKWLHFGLGDQNTIEKVEVRWPTGNTQSLSCFEADRFYKIKEGQQEPMNWVPPVVAAVESGTAVATRPVESSATQLLLGQPMPLPPLYFETTAGDREDASRTTGKARLITLWATWCKPCLAELKEWRAREPDFREAGIELLALSVDHLSVEKGGSKDVAANYLQELGFQFPFGWGTTELLDVMQLINNSIYHDDHRRLPVPTSMLVDPNGKLAAVYKGPVSVDRILADSKLLSLDEQPRLASTLPFPGRWIGLPGPHRMAKLVDKMLAQGFEGEAVELVKRMPLAKTDDVRLTDEKVKALHALRRRHQAAGRLEQARKSLQQVLSIRPADGNAHLELGILFAKQDDLHPAIRHFQQAVEYSDPPSLSAHLNLAQAYRRTGQLDQSLREYQRAIAVGPNSVLAHSGQGLLYASQAKFTEAVSSFLQAVELEPSNIQHRNNLATAYLRQGKPDLALEQFDQVLTRDPNSVVAQISAVDALTALRRHEEAIARLRKLLQQQPDQLDLLQRLGAVYMQIADYRKAIVCFRRMNNLLPNDPTILGNLAWLLATVPDESVRNGQQAVELAFRAANLTKRGSPQLLDALAAAYAENGQFEEAKRVAAEALKLLENVPRQPVAAAIKSRLALYQKGQPYHLPNRSKFD